MHASTLRLQLSKASKIIAAVAVIHGVYLPIISTAAVAAAAAAPSVRLGG